MADLIPKQKARYPLWFRAVSTAAAAFFLISIVSFFGLIYLNGHEQERVENLEILLSQGKLPQEISLEKRIFGVKERIEDFTNIVNTRKDMRPFLGFFEENTHPGIYFSQFSLNATKGTVSVTGSASSFQALEQQIQILKGHEGVEEMILSSVGFGEKGQVSFGFELELLL
tara:strand:+ start:485 stop:997 length:513 start_codon:yes stop_codon:yes gene_type:complete